MFGIFTNPADLPPAQAATLRRIERKLDLIMAHLKIESDETEHELPTEAQHHANTGNVIAAIRAHREATGAGLAEAKEAVDRFIASRRRGEA